MASRVVAGAGYGKLLRMPAIARVVAAQLAARSPQGMSGLGLLFKRSLH